MDRNVYTQGETKQGFAMLLIMVTGKDVETVVVVVVVRAYLSGLSVWTSHRRSADQSTVIPQHQQTTQQSSGGGGGQTDRERDRQTHKQTENGDDGG